MNPLTRDEWIELWATITTLEYDLIHFPIDRHSGPFLQRQQNKAVIDMLNAVRVVKQKLAQEI